MAFVSALVYQRRSKDAPIAAEGEKGERSVSENRRIARAAGLVGILTLLSRIAGLVRDVVVGFYFGTSAAADAFFVAFRIPNLLRRFVAEGAMSLALIPVFTDYVTNRTRAEAQAAMSAVATLMTVALLVLTALGVLFAPQLTALFAPGFASDPEKFALTIELTRRIFPFIFLVSLLALATGILHSVRHFAAPAFAPVLLNLAIIAAALVSQRFDEPVLALAWGVVAGGVAQLLIQVPPLVRHGIRLRPAWDPQHEAVRRSLVLMAPMLFGAAVYQINVLVSTVFASLLPTGSVSYLWYAGRVFEFPLGIFAVALGTAALPSFSSQASRGAYDEMARSLSFSLRLMILIVLPATVGLYVLAEPITNVLFQRGAYGAVESAFTAQALQAYVVGLLPVSLARILAPAFYALGDTRTPVVAAAVAFAVNLAASLMLMGAVPTGPGPVTTAIAALTQWLEVVDLRHSGLALATSIAAAANFAFLVVKLKPRLPALNLGDLLPALGRASLASTAMIPVLIFVSGWADWSSPAGIGGRAAVLALAVAAGTAVFALILTLLGGEETVALRRQLAARFQRR